MRINELARELEVKARTVIEYLTALYPEEKLSHSSAIDDGMARKVKAHFSSSGAKDSGSALAAGKTAPPAVIVVTPAASPEPAKETNAPVVAPAAPIVSAAPIRKPVAPLESPVAPPPAPAAGGRRPLRPPIRSSADAAPPAAVVASAAPPAATAAPVAQPVASSIAAPAITASATPATTPAAAPAIATQVPRATPLVPGRMPLPVRPPAGAPVGAPGRPQPGMPLRPATPGTGLRPPIAPRPGHPTRPGAPAGGTASPGRPGMLPQRPPLPPRPAFNPPRPGLRTPGTPPKLGPVRPGEPIYPRRPQRPAGDRPGQPGTGFPSPVGVVPPDPGQRRGPHPVRGRQHPTGARTARDRETAAERLLRGPARHKAPEPIVVDREITVTEGITVKDLSEKLGIKAKDLIRRLLDQGIIATINHSLDPAMAEQVAQSFGARTKIVSFEEESVGLEEVAVDASKMVKRAPVVTVMGHVDHGKTSLLDAIRETNVTASEHGGITQHIGAYSVTTNGRRIVFLDTPGHEAFTRMRARGAKVTDVVVLVVSADDGVMPQTLEAISHAKLANVPIIVAINKIDKPGSLPERVRKQLADQGLQPEDWGGDTVMVEVSAKQRTNISTLLEMILLVTDIQDRKANPEAPASGTVLEAKLDKGRGPVCSLLVINGTLRVGDNFLVGPVFGKVRAMLDDHGRPIAEAPPATPVEILGLQSLPQAGDHFQAVTDAIKAKQLALYRENKQRELMLAKSSRLTLEQFQDQLKSGVAKELPIILKGDVQGSVEVIAESLGKIGDERVKVRVLHAAAGAITVSDVLLASASNSVVVGFNVRPERKAVDLAQQENVEIRLHTVIYDLIDEMRKALTGLLEPTHREVALGKAEVRQAFRVAKIGAVAGSLVSEGKLQQGCSIRVLRDDVVIHTGKIGSLKRFKDDVNEVRSGQECGIVIENFSDVKAGDMIEAFVTERVAAAALA